MKLIKIKNKDKNSADSIIERKSIVGENTDMNLLLQAESVYDGFRPFRERRARVIRFVYEDQWGDLITVNGKTMTQRQYLSQVGNVALQANLMASKANSIVGSHIKEGGMPSLHARTRAEQGLAEVLSEALRANWEHNDAKELEITAQQELLYGGLAVMKESFERLNGADDAWSRLINPNMVAFSASMQDSRLEDLSMVVELHDYTFNELCAAFADSKDDYEQLRDWYYDEASPLKMNDTMDVVSKLDTSRLTFFCPADTKNCRVIEIWTKERRPRYHVFDQQKAELYDINADDKEIIAQIEATNKARREEALKLGFSEDEIPLIELHYFIDTYWFYRFLTPTGYIIKEGESELPGRNHPYTICASPFVNGKICGFLSDAVDLQMAINRELVIYDWMKRLDTKGVTFVPQNIIPDGMSYSDFAEQWTSMDGIIFYKPTNNGDKPFVEHGGAGNIDTAGMVKMLADTMAESVSVSGAIQGKTPYAGTSAQLYAQQKENSTTPIAVIADKLENFIKHAALKKAQFIQLYYTPKQFEEIAGMMVNVNWENINLSDMPDIRYDFKMEISADHTSLRQESNELLLNLFQMGAMNINDVLELGEFANADNIIERLNERAAEMAQQQAMISSTQPQKNNNGS